MQDPRADNAGLCTCVLMSVGVLTVAAARWSRDKAGWRGIRLRYASLSFVVIARSCLT